MFASLLVLLLNTSAAVAPTEVADLPKLFEAACMDGQVHFAPGAAAPITFKELPRELRGNLGKPSSGQVWRLSGNSNAFLYLLNYDNRRDMSPRVCGVASDQLDYVAAAQALEVRLTGTVHPGETRSSEWISPQNGYRALATRTGKFKVIQVNWLNEAQREAALRMQKELRR